MSARIRAFLAFELPSGLRARLAEEQAQVARELPRARWVRPDGAHVTVKFLGETTPEVLDALSSDLAAALAGRGPVRLSFAGAGFFPTATRARVAWIGGEAAAAAAVAAIVEGIASGHGFARERRPWRLHLTVARLDRPWPAAAAARLLEWGDRLRLEDVVCTELTLLESRLGPGGAVYTARERFPLE